MKEILVYSLLVLSSLIFTSSIAAQYNEVEHEYLSFAADQDTKLMLSNKYGGIVCETWDKDSIGVQVTISSSSKKRESVSRIMNSVEIESIKFGNTVEVETSFRDNASLIKSYLGKLDPFNSNELTIEYVVSFPDGIDMEIINRFGNVSIEQSKSDIDIDLEYGDLRLESMAGDLKLRLKSGRLSGRKLKRAEFDARNYDIRLKYIDYALLELNHCDVKVDEIDFARIDLVGGELDLDEVNTVSGFANANADINIELLNKDLELEVKNSAVMIEEFDEKVSTVIINEVSSTIDLNISNFSFSLEADVEESQFSVPKSISNIERVVHDERKQSRTISFSYGVDNVEKCLFKLTGQKGSIFLIED